MNSTLVELLPAWEWWRNATLLGWRATGTERERIAFASASLALLLVAIGLTLCFWVRLHRALRNSAACCAERTPSGTEPQCADPDNGFDEEVQDAPAPGRRCSTVREEAGGASGAGGAGGADGPGGGQKTRKHAVQKNKYFPKTASKPGNLFIHFLFCYVIKLNYL